jgi:GrpB-like predicted nucleotidyltransferase (UPF0157 family)/GNAT superfamily N-acetyltransferase
MNETKHIEVVPYNPDWPLVFAAEAELIKEALGDGCIEIHHIGSTSVPGLASKPIIDIIAAVNQLDTSLLELIGYQYRGEMHMPFRKYFSQKSRTRVNLHIYEEGNPEIELNILFRNYLISSKQYIEEYSKLKADLLKQKESYEKNNSKFTGYNLGKDIFIRKILKKAGFDKLRLLYCTHHQEWASYHRIRDEQIFKPIKVIYDKDHPSLNAQNHFHFVLCKGVEIVSIAHVEFLNETAAAIRSLATDEPYKQKGYAAHLMKLIEKWLKHHGRSIIKMHAHLRAEKFYRKLGYVDMEFDDVSISKEVIDLGKVL